jgi:hypothetical protein
MRLHRVSVAICFSLAGGLNASDIGIAVNGTCEAGSCPATPVPFNSTAALPFDFTFALPNGDMYQIYGSFSVTNDTDGTGGSNIFAFQVDYEGSSSGGGPSAADSIIVQRNAAFQASVSSVNFNTALTGAFGPTIAASSSASTCFGGTLACLGPVSPPGSFNQNSTFPITNISGSYTDDKTFTSNFGAGSPVGSYIVWGQTTPLPAPTPEPASVGLLTLGLAGIIARRARGIE